jgi:hypothetical protein
MMTSTVVYSQNSSLQIQGSGFGSRRYHIFWEVVGLEQGPLSLVSTTEELLGRCSSGTGLEKRDNYRRDPPRSPRDTLYQQQLALTSPTSGGRSVGIIRKRTKAMELAYADMIHLHALWLAELRFEFQSGQDFSCHHVQIGCEDSHASCPRIPGASLPGGKATGVPSWQFTCTWSSLADQGKPPSSPDRLWDPDNPLFLTGDTFLEERNKEFIST